MKTPRPSLLIWSVGGVLLAICAGLFLAREQRARETDSALRSSRNQQEKRALLLVEKRRLEAQLPSAQELENLRADHTALLRLREEIEELKSRPRPVKKVSAQSDTSGLNGYTPAASWKNAGRGSARATLESALWAASSGDIEELAKLLTLSGGARDKANALWENLPASEKSKYPSPEYLVALLTAREVNFDGMRLERSTDAPDSAQLKVNFHRSNGLTKDAVLSLTKLEAGWSLVVPPEAIDRYRTVLLGSGTTASR